MSLQFISSFKEILISLITRYEVIYVFKNSQNDRENDFESKKNRFNKKNREKRDNKNFDKKNSFSKIFNQSKSESRANTSRDRDDVFKFSNSRQQLSDLNIY